jgi:prepilin-type N-terminal cleavage/methylation domain-containing protein
MRNAMKHVVMSKRSTKDSRMNQKGFSLVELLISFVLIAILTTGTAQLAVHSLLVKRRADCNFISAELASSLLEYFKSLPYESDELKEGFLKESAGGEGILGTFWKEWRIQDLSPNMKRIEIESYAQSCSQKKVRLVLLLSRELGF